MKQVFDLGTLNGMSEELSNPLNPDGSLRSDWSNTDPMVDDHPGHHNYLAAAVNRHEAQLEKVNNQLPSGGKAGQVLAVSSDPDKETEWVTLVPDTDSADDGDVLTVSKGASGSSTKWATLSGGGGGGGTSLPSIKGQTGKVLGVVDKASGDQKLSWVSKGGGGGGDVPDPSGHSGERLTSTGSGMRWERPRVVYATPTPPLSIAGEDGDLWVEYSE